MLEVENTDIHGWRAAIRGARNPMNSWEKSDTWFGAYYNSDYEETSVYSLDGTPGTIYDYDENTVEWNEHVDITGMEESELEFLKKDPDVVIEKDPEGNVCCVYIKHHDPIVWPNHRYHIDTIVGQNDYKLLMNLCKGGTEESKWRRFINVTMDVTAPLYWWKEFETYKVGTVSNSCSTMHKIQAKEFTLDDFSGEHLGYFDLDDRTTEQEYCKTAIDGNGGPYYPMDLMTDIIDVLNHNRELFNETKEKKYWWQMIQLLPSSFNQRRTIQLNYEVLAKQYKERKNHKLDEWHQYCDWIKTLPYSEFITMEGPN